jgi:hypothetical protein
MLQKLKDWLNRHKHKETEIRRLKEEIDNGLSECKRRAAAGDQRAIQKLRDFEETINAQSVRFLRNVKP